MNSFRTFNGKNGVIFEAAGRAGGRGIAGKTPVQEKPLPTPMAIADEVSFHRMPRPEVDLQPDAGIAKALFGIGRLINDDYHSLSAYISEMMKYFEGAKSCSIYLGAKREMAGKRKTVLEHHVTVHTNGDVKTESLGKKDAVLDKKNPLLRSYNQKKPRLIDYKEGMEIIFRNLDRESDRCDVYAANNGLFEEAVAIVPFYYREKNKPYGVIVIEGDLRCKGSEKTGFTKVYYSAKAAILAGMQTAFVFTQKFDWTTRFPGKRDFEIDFKKNIRQLSKQRSKNGPESTYFILIDLDRFKLINDTYGYLNGDVVLRMAANEIENSLREGDRLRPGDKYFRWGGEEFAILAENMALAEAFIVAERIRKKIKEMKVNVGDKEISVTCSIGLVDIATMLDKIDVKGEASKPVFEKCNMLLKMAKESGRDRIAFYDERGNPKFLNDY